MSIAYTSELSLPCRYTSAYRRCPIHRVPRPIPQSSCSTWDSSISGRKTVSHRPSILSRARHQVRRHQRRRPAGLNLTEHHPVAVGARPPKQFTVDNPPGSSISHSAFAFRIKLNSQCSGYPLIPNFLRHCNQVMKHSPEHAAFAQCSQMRHTCATKREPAKRGLPTNQTRDKVDALPLQITGCHQPAERHRSLGMADTQHAILTLANQLVHWFPYRPGIAREPRMSATRAQTYHLSDYDFNLHVALRSSSLPDTVLPAHAPPLRQHPATTPDSLYTDTPEARFQTQ